MFNYAELTQRNGGYVPADIQTKIGNLRILIAGCGIGSAIAIALTRTDKNAKKKNGAAE